MLQDGRPVGLTWTYDRTELLTDGAVHVVGLGFALIGAVVLIVVSLSSTEGLETAATLVYAVGLLAMLGFSAAYNIWPVSPRKWALRRLDHSAIYLFIAATYTPLFAQMQPATAPYPDDPRTAHVIPPIAANSNVGSTKSCVKSL